MAYLSSYSQSKQKSEKDFWQILDSELEGKFDQLSKKEKREYRGKSAKQIYNEKMTSFYDEKNYDRKVKRREKNLSPNPYLNNNISIINTVFLPIVEKTLDQDVETLLNEYLTESERVSLKGLKISIKEERYSSNNFLVSSKWKRKTPVIEVKSNLFLDEIFDTILLMDVTENKEHASLMYISPLLSNVFSEYPTLNSLIIFPFALTGENSQDVTGNFFSNSKKMINGYNILSTRQNFYYLHEIYHLLNKQRTYTSMEEINADKFAIRKILGKNKELMSDKISYLADVLDADTTNIRTLSQLGTLRIIGNAFYLKQAIKATTNEKIYQKFLYNYKLRFDSFKDTIQSVIDKGSPDTRYQNVAGDIQMIDMLHDMSISFYEINKDFDKNTALIDSEFIFSKSKNEKLNIGVFFLLKGINEIKSKNTELGRENLIKASNIPSTKEISNLLLGYYYYIIRGDDLKATFSLDEGLSISEIIPSKYYNNLINYIKNNPSTKR